MKQEHIKHHYVLPVTSFVKISSLNTTLIYFIKMQMEKLAVLQ